MNLNSQHTKWALILLLSMLAAYCFWDGHPTTLIFLIPFSVVIGSWELAARWERKQPSRLSARYHSRKFLVLFFFLLTFVWFFAVLFSQVYLDSKTTQGVNLGAMAIIFALIHAERDRKKIFRWAKRISPSAI